jgi:hypothetical protein
VSGTTEDGAATDSLGGECNTRGPTLEMTKKELLEHYHTPLSTVNVYMNKFAGNPGSGSVA